MTLHVSSDDNDSICKMNGNVHVIVESHVNHSDVMIKIEKDPLPPDVEAAVMLAMETKSEISMESIGDICKVTQDEEEGRSDEEKHDEEGGNDSSGDDHSATSETALITGEEERRDGKDNCQSEAASHGADNGQSLSRQGSTKAKRESGDSATPITTQLSYARTNHDSSVKNPPASVAMQV